MAVVYLGFTSYAAAWLVHDIGGSFHELDVYSGGRSGIGVLGATSFSGIGRSLVNGETGVRLPLEDEEGDDVNFVKGLR